MNMITACSVTLCAHCSVIQQDSPDEPVCPLTIPKTFKSVSLRCWVTQHIIFAHASLTPLSDCCTKMCVCVCLYMHIFSSWSAITECLRHRAKSSPKTNAGSQRCSFSTCHGHNLTCNVNLTIVLCARSKSNRKRGSPLLLTDIHTKDHSAFCTM